MWKLSDVNSINAGAKKFEIKRGTKGYDSCEKILEEIYLKYGSSDYYDIYQYMQGFDRCCWSREDSEKRLEELRNFAKKFSGKWGRIFSTVDTNWIKFDPDLPENFPIYDNFAMIKVYVSVKDIARTYDIYCGAVKKLLEKAKWRFHSKASNYKRNDSIVFWVSKTDFYILEEYFSEFGDELVCKMPFIPYYGKLGISREYLLLGSYSAVLAELMSKYFFTVSSASEIDLGNMYSYLIQQFNRKLSWQDRTSEGLMDFTAQTVLVMLDSIDIITGRTKLTKNHLLMSEDTVVWHALNCLSWEEVEKNYFSNIKDYNDDHCTRKIFTGKTL